MTVECVTITVADAFVHIGADKCQKPLLCKTLGSDANVSPVLANFSSPD